MATGRTHDIVNLSFLPVAVYYLQPESFSGFISGYLVGTFLITPDNDIYHSKPNRRWKFFRFLWYPYTKLFSHRGVSHLPIIGSFIKLIYLFIVLSIFATFLISIMHFFWGVSVVENLKNIGKEEIFYIIKNPFVVSFLIGLVLAEIVHIITDVVYSSIKKVLR